MWESKDFIVPHFNYIPHFEKPIFAYLLTALSIGVFGANSLAVRFPSVLAAISGIFLTHAFTRRLFDEKKANLAAMILSTSVGYFLLGRYGMIDMLMTFFLSAALFGLAAAVIQKDRRFYPAAYLFMGLAFITKGLVGIVLPVLIFTAYLVWTKNLAEVKRMRLGWGLLIIGLVFVPWGIAISIREPEFSYVFITQQHFERFATGSFGRARPFWFFIPILISLAFPWSLFLPTAAIHGLRDQKGDERKMVQFLLCWVSVILLFFSIPRSKLPYYILPVSVPLSVLVAVWFDQATEPKTLRLLLKCAGLILVVAIGGFNAYLFFWAEVPIAETIRNLVLPGTICVLAGCAVIANYTRKSLYRSAAWAMAGTLYAAMIIIAAGMFFLSPYFSTYKESQTLKFLWKEGDTIAVYSSPDHFSDLPFHLQKRIMVVGSDFGTLTSEVEERQHEKELDRWFLSAGKFVELFSLGKTRMFCLMKAKSLGELQHLGLRKLSVINEGAGKILISNEIPSATKP